MIRAKWFSSLLGKIAAFLFTGIFVAYLVGAGVGWTMMERSQRDQWHHQAELNSQIASATIRAIYTFVAVEVSAAGQTTRIISERPIGDDQSVLDTGFVPADVLALASAQTKQKVWLFRWDAEGRRFLSITDGGGEDVDKPLAFAEGQPAPDFRIDFLRIGTAEHFGGFIPILTRDGTVLGALVASAGRTETLTAARWRLFADAALLLLVVIAALGMAIILLMRGLFRPVPALIHALTRLARDETDKVTPYQERTDEIGDLAVAIETLRAAVVEREELRKVQEIAMQMEHLAHHDSLTGLPNRALFQKSLRAAIDGMADGGGRVNLLLVDLDHFKPVNDTFGHGVGDKVLAMSCQRMAAVLGSHDLAARLGGDEFAVIQKTSFNPVREAEKLALRLVETIAQPFEIEGGPTVSIGVSIGVACSPSHGDTVADLIRNADLALYASKHAGRGKFHIFRPGMTMPSNAGTDAGKDLLLALARGEFELHYQPVFGLSDGRVRGYEALLRWRRPNRGLVSPAAFIPLAEESGAILPIGRWVIEQACADGLKLNDEIVVSVNVSAVQIERDDIAAIVGEAVAKTGFPARRLEIELTESVELEHERARHTLTRLREMGVKIAIDDFGTGYATFSHLATLPITRLKIDRQFVGNLATSHASRRIIAGAVAIAHELGLSTTAEGAETAEQAALLRAAGCGSVQGYYFGRPAPLEVILDDPARHLAISNGTPS